MLVILFYYKNGKAAKQRAIEITSDKKHLVRIYDVSVWSGNQDACDEVEIMPDVPKWHKRRIMQAFQLSDQPIDDDQSEAIVHGETEQATKAVEMPTAGAPIHQANVDIPLEELLNSPEVKAEPVVKMAIHKGAGRWAVVQNGVEISGPHSRDEAKRLALI